MLKNFTADNVQQIDMKFFNHADLYFSCKFWEESGFLPNSYVSYIFKKPHALHLMNLSQLSLYTVRCIKKIETRYFHGKLFNMRSDRRGT